ncbi:MAG: Rpn family recombination-promoting nuclease/putative transposase [Gammaproteobacteria bacterium]|nr:Rpn family recombination-promoting nuclease/putative transposase [Gammaproteobacteria bacterium]MDE0257167.1 Rpn family recombination-promoting nuclease/putative transposase [Gammaproteobacteria bacterium]
MHDAVSKVLYSLPDTVQALVRALAPSRAAETNFSKLRRLSAEYPATERRQRYGDMVWTCRLHDGAAVLIVIEFQSKIDHAMPLRLLQYTAAAWLEWARAAAPAAGEKVPLVMPVLVYGGRRPWTPPSNLVDLFPAVGARWLAAQPRYEYLLLEERRGGTTVSPEHNLVGALLSVARARDSEAMVRAVSRLRHWTHERRGGALDRAVAEWLKSVISALDAGLEDELAAANTTSEVMEVIKPTGKWAVRWYEDGLDDGRAQGIERGIEQQLRLLRRLVARKFGAEVAREIVGSVEALAAPDVVGVVFDAAIDCDGTDEFLARVSGAGVSCEAAS